jgi:hypothetical protein
MLLCTAENLACRLEVLTQVYTALIMELSSALDRWIRVIAERSPVHVTNATLNTNPECRSSAKSFFSLDESACSCYVKTNTPIPGCILR